MGSFDLLSQANARIHFTTKYKFWVFRKNVWQPQTEMEYGNKTPWVINTILGDVHECYRRKKDCYKPQNRGSVFPATEHNQKQVSSLENNEENA